VFVVGKRAHETSDYRNSSSGAEVRGEEWSQWKFSVAKTTTCEHAQAVAVGIAVARREERMSG